MWNLPHLVTFGLLISNTAALNCSIKPFSVPFENVTGISSYPDHGSAHKGIAINIGSDETKLAVGFGTTLNATFVPDGDLVCDVLDPAGKQCVFWRGGLFSPNSSNTFSKDSGTIPYNGSVANPGFDYLNHDTYSADNQDPLSNFPRGWDTLVLEDHHLFGYPLTIVNNASFAFSAGFIGAASDSNFLKFATNASLIPSRSWSIDYGTNEYGKLEKGEVVMGGYNSEKVSWGDFKNYTIFPDKSKPCPLQVSVKNLKWGKRNLMDSQGKLHIIQSLAPTSNIKIGLDPFMACVEPAYHTNIFPYQVQKNWNSSIEDAKFKIVAETWEFIYFNQTNGGEISQDDIVIELQDGFTVNIPVGEMVQPRQQLVPEGGWKTVKNSYQAYVGNAGFDKPKVTPALNFLGAPFLSQVYLAVNYESSVFSLARKSDSKPSKSGLIPLACDDYHDPATTKSKASSSSTSPSPNNTPKIVGGAIGGAIGLIAIAGIALFCFWRTRRQHEQTNTTLPQLGPQTEKVDEQPAPGYTSTYGSYSGFLAPGSPPPPHESPYSPSGTPVSQWATSPHIPLQQMAGYTGGGTISSVGRNSSFVEAVEIGGSHTQAHEVPANT